MTQPQVGAELFFNVDNLVINSKAWRLTGWAISPNATLTRASVTLSGNGPRERHRLSIGRYRPDVRNSYGHIGASSRAGFDGFGATRISSPRRVDLDLTFSDGSTQTMDITRFVRGLSARRARLQSQLRMAATLVNQKRYRHLGRKIFQRGAEAAKLLAIRRSLPSFREPVGLIIDHGMGGGASHFAKQLAKDLIATGKLTVCIIRFALHTLEYTMEYRSKDRSDRYQAGRFIGLHQLLRAVRPGEIHVNSTVSYPDNANILSEIEQFITSNGTPFYFYFHDYYAICPSFNLLNQGDEFCGVPSQDVCKVCLANHNDLFVLSQGVSEIGKWRSEWGQFLATAERIRFFSQASFDLFTRAYPDFDASNCFIQEHRVEPLPKTPLRPSDTLTIAVVGSIQKSKGAGKVLSLCQYISDMQIEARIVVVGSVDVDLDFDFVRITGPYSPDELSGILSRQGVNVAFFPSIWPETYSFVFAELQQLGLPIVAYDLGAPAERMDRTTGVLLPLGASPELIVKNLRAVALRTMASPAAVRTARICVFTSAATNYLPKAMLLGRSIRKFHPEADLVYGLCDAQHSEVDYRAGVFSDVIAASELDIPEFESWSFRHSIVELATAIKPFLLTALLRRGYEQVFYFDPDIVLFSPLDDLFEGASGSSITLTPHQTAPESDFQSIIDNEIASLKYGVYNLGFLGVTNTPEGQSFAEWWRERLYQWCRDDIPNGLFTDQRWIDLVPALFEDVRIERSPRFNVSTWNVTNRHVSEDLAGQFSVNGLPLGFYHFTGFDKGDHRIMAEKNSRNNPAVMKLVNWYQREIAPTSNNPVSRIPWAFGAYADGTPIPDDHRRLYRARRDLQLAFPMPFASTEHSGLRSWIRSEGAQVIKGRAG